MNWTTRINNIVQTLHPMGGSCQHIRQATMRARIAKSDEIKRSLTGRTEQEQRKIIEGWEHEAGIVILNPN